MATKTVNHQLVVIEIPKSKFYLLDICNDSASSDFEVEQARNEIEKTCDVFMYLHLVMD